MLATGKIELELSQGQLQTLARLRKPGRPVRGTRKTPPVAIHAQRVGGYVIHSGRGRGVGTLPIRRLDGAAAVARCDGRICDHGRHALHNLPISAGRMAT